MLSYDMWEIRNKISHSQMAMMVTAFGCDSSLIEVSVEWGLDQPDKDKMA